MLLYNENYTDPHQLSAVESRTPISGHYPKDVDLSFGKMVSILRSHLRQIVTFTLAGTLLSGALIGVFWQDSYSSVSILSLKPDDMPEYVTQGVRRNVQVFQDVNPFRNQEEILRSPILLNRLKEKLRKDPALSKVEDIDTIENSLQFFRIKQTEFFRLKVTRLKPQEAKGIADIYLQCFMQFSQEQSRQSYKKQKMIIEKQIRENEFKLADINEQIRNYQQENSDADLNLEIGEHIRRIETLKQQVNDTEALLAQTEKTRDGLQKRLGLDVHLAIESTARGQNESYTNLSNQLAELNRSYWSKSITYSQTHPYMVKLKEKIEYLEKEIQDQEILTLGHRPNSKLIVKDNVRIDMIQQLTRADVEANGLTEKLNVYRTHLSQAEDELRQFPEKQVNLNSLTLKQQQLGQIIDKLHSALADVDIHVSYTPLNVVMKPTLPKEAAAPNRIHLICLAFFVSLLLPLISVSRRHYHIFRDTPHAEYLQNILNIPVLTTIPWLSSKQLKSNLAVIDNAFKDLAISLVADQSNTQRQIVVFASLLSGSKQSTSVLTRTGIALALAGHRVLVIETDKNISLNNTVIEDLNSDTLTLPEIITQINTMLAQHNEVNPAILANWIKQVIKPSSINPNLFYINIGNLSGNSFELFFSRGFDVFLQATKLNFNWTLIDVPPLISKAEGYTIATKADGTVLIIEQKATKEQFQQVYKKLRFIKAPLIGTVIREFSCEYSCR